jgi:hypothetical protein
MERKLEDQPKPGRDSEAWRKRLAKDVAALDLEHRQVWGDTDEVLCGRYVAGMCTADEKARVEQAMRDYPAVRESIEVAREVHAQRDVPTENDAVRKPNGGKPWSGVGGPGEPEPGASR